MLPQQRQNLVLWTDVETTGLARGPNIVEISIEVAPPFSNDAPLYDFHSFVIPTTCLPHLKGLKDLIGGKPQKRLKLEAETAAETPEEEDGHGEDYDVFAHIFGLNPWCTDMFKKNGLGKELMALIQSHTVTELVELYAPDAVDNRLVKWYTDKFGSTRRGLAGKNVHFDLDKIRDTFPKFACNCLTYSLFDVITLYIARDFKTGVREPPRVPSQHRARTDVADERREAWELYHQLVGGEEQRT